MNVSLIQAPLLCRQEDVKQLHCVRDPSTPLSVAYLKTNKQKHDMGWADEVMTGFGRFFWRLTLRGGGGLVLWS